ncbi:FeoB-associated Cys-rich membrane protein [Listeria grandensis]|uniref:FeoB-associated Cys-rich membrane protein n=1 Tax=Listeria grandensis TaxID=1494963 RepID=UPI0021AB3B17|nr:FeoB-associated Cys-rich membrane protein [Listeria grandensis]
MSFIVNFLIGGLIFGYATYTLIRYLHKSKEGKCGGCDLEKTCEQDDTVSFKK